MRYILRISILLCIVFLNLELNAACCSLFNPTTTVIPSPSAFVSSPIVFAPPNGQCLATANGNNRSISIFQVVESSIGCSLSNGETIVLFNTGSAQSVAFSPDGACLAVGYREATSDEENAIFLFQVIPGPNGCTLSNRSELIIPEHAGRVPHIIAFSPNGLCLATVDNNSNTISMYPVIQGPTGCTLDDMSRTDYATGNFSLALAFSPDGNCLVTANALDDTVSLFRVNGCTLSDRIDIPTGGEFPLSIAFSPNGNCLAIINRNSQNLTLFQVVQSDSGCMLENPQLIPVPSLMGAGDVAWSPNGNCLVTTGGGNNVSFFSVVESPTGECFLLSPTTFSIDANSSRVVFSPNGNCIALLDSGGPNSTITIARTFLVSPTFSNVTVNCNRTVSLIGTADPLVTIDIFVDGSLIGSTMTDNTGNFSITIGPLSSGLRNISAISTNGAGCLSDSSELMLVTIPLVPIIEGVTTTCAAVIVFGTTVANTSVTLLVDGIPVGSVVSDRRGKFVFVNPPVSGGFHRFVVQVMQEGCVLTSAPFDILINFPNNCSPLSASNLVFGTHCNV